MKQEEKVLTREVVEELGLNKLEIITSNMLEGYTSIRGYAFWYCNSITSITIPNSVTSIGEYVFRCCSGLTSITISNSVTSIGYGAFSYCSGLASITVENGNTRYDSRNNCNAIIETDTNTLITGCKNTTIPNSVTSIGDLAFIGCRNLTSITIPNSVTSIGNYAFEGCTGLTSITISDSVTSIGLEAFKGCTGLTSIIIPNSVTSIEKWAFNDCTDLTSITIPNSIKCIDKYAFFYCNKLKNVVIGDKVYKKHKVIKNKCKAYKAFNADLTCLGFQYKEGKTYEIEGEPILCEQGFHACLRLTDVFNHYRGEIGKDIVVYEVELEGVSDERNDDDSKVVAKKITIGKRIL